MNQTHESQKGKFEKSGLECINDCPAEAPSKGSNSWHLAWSVSQPSWALILVVASKISIGSQIILSIILAVQNNNHTQKHKYLHGKPFLLKGKKKTMGQTSNNFTIIKPITIIFVYVSRLKKNLSYFSLLTHTHTHTNYLFQRQQHFALSS